MWRMIQDARINLRIDTPRHQRIQAAATQAGVSVGAFVADAATTAADMLLADSTRTVITADQWDEFHRALDAPPRRLPRLAAAIERHDRLLGGA
jgi:uncharacterized protein (DUF1778 family)